MVTTTYRLAVLAAAVLAVAGASLPTGTAVVSTAAGTLRLQALNAFLLRVEVLGPRGWVDNNTLVVPDRSAFTGVPLTEAANSSAKTWVGETAMYRVEVVREAQPTCGFEAGAGPDCKAERCTRTPGQQPRKAATTGDCCQLCEAEPVCHTFIHDPVGQECWMLEGTPSLGPAPRNTGYASSAGRVSVFSKRTGQLQWTSNPQAMRVAPTDLVLPSPHDFKVGAEALPRAWWVRDGPRIVPPAWNATPAPAGKDLGPLQNTSGFDYRDAAPDVYIIVGLPDMPYQTFISQVIQLLQPPPSIPDWAFGIWFTWFHPYTQAEKEAEISKWLALDLPYDVASLDMDWRNHSNDNSSAIYEINKELFPDMAGFFKFCHDHNLKTFFNDHPYPQAPQMSPREIEFRWHGLTSILDLGLDFWWFDCHWRFSTPAVTLDNATMDYVAWGEYYYWSMMQRYNAEKRAAAHEPTMMLGCFNSHHPLSHRTPTWWTGDIWYNTLTTALHDEVQGGLDLKPYVHPDCGGHHSPDTFPGEVYARWTQFCSMGTIVRLHSAPNTNRLPWSFGEQALNITRTFFKLRQQFSPTLVAAGKRAATDGTPIVRRLDFAYPLHNESTRMDQYLLGDDLLVAPIDPFPTPDNITFNRQRTVWFPPGTWSDMFRGETFQGPATVTLSRNMDEMPLFMQSGAVLLCAEPARNIASQREDARVAELFLSADGLPVRTTRRTIMQQGLPMAVSLTQQAHSRATMAGKQQPAAFGAARITVRPEHPNAAATAPAAAEGKVECALCELVLDIVKDDVANASKAEITKALDNVCDIVPKTLTQECRDFVSFYATPIIYAFEQNLNPSAVCREIDVCPRNSTASTRGGSLHLPKAVGGAAAAEGKVECALCELVLDIVKDDVANASKAEITKALDNVCDIVPKTLTQECRDFVSFYATPIIYAFEQNLNPSAVCREIDVCPRNSTASTRGGSLHLPEAVGAHEWTFRFHLPTLPALDGLAVLVNGRRLAAHEFTVLHARQPGAVAQPVVGRGVRPAAGLVVEVAATWPGADTNSVVLQPMVAVA